MCLVAHGFARDGFFNAIDNTICLFVVIVESNVRRSGDKVGKYSAAQNYFTFRQTGKVGGGIYKIDFIESRIDFCFEELIVWRNGYKGKLFAQFLCCCLIDFLVIGGYLIEYGIVQCSIQRDKRHEVFVCDGVEFLARHTYAKAGRCGYACGFGFGGKQYGAILILAFFRQAADDFQCFQVMEYAVKAGSSYHNAVRLRFDCGCVRIGYIAEEVNGMKDFFSCFFGDFLIGSAVHNVRNGSNRNAGEPCYILICWFSRFIVSHNYIILLFFAFVNGDDMNKQAIFHIPDSNYCYAVSENTVELLLRTDKNDRFDAVNVIYGNKYDYHLKQEKAAMVLRFCDDSFSYYFIRLSLADVRFVYVFQLIYGGDVFYFSEDGLTASYDFSFAYFNSFQLPYINKADVMPMVEWLRNGVFYQIFIDRFYSKNISEKAYVNLAWGDIPTPESFAGGDLDGIAKKLDYIKNLGADTLYLTPIFKARSNHKYNITDYYTVDGQFGGNAAFGRLVRSAHEKGIKIVLDAVFNHCDKSLKQFRDVVKNGKKSKFYDWFIIKGDKPDEEKGNYEYFGVCKYMPKLNTSNPQVQKYLIDIAVHWIKKYDIDGWRLDVSDEVSHEFWRKFRIAVKKVKTDVAVIGENWHNAYPYLCGDQFDSIMNYSFTKAVTDFIIGGGTAKAFKEKLSALYVRNKRQANDMMLNLLDSHDTHRFYTLAGEDSDKLIAALALVFFQTGSACVYYGTEIPLAGGYDPDCRRTMDWAKASEPGAVGKIIQELAKIKKSPVMTYGEIDYEYSGELFVAKRRLPNSGNNSGGELMSGDFKAGNLKACGGLKLTVAKNCAEYVAKNIVLSHNYVSGGFSGTGFVIEGVTE